MRQFSFDPFHVFFMISSVGLTRTRADEHRAQSRTVTRNTRPIGRCWPARPFGRGGAGDREQGGGRPPRAQPQATDRDRDDHTRTGQRSTSARLATSGGRSRRWRGRRGEGRRCCTSAVHRLRPSCRQRTSGLGQRQHEALARSGTSPRPVAGPAAGAAMIHRPSAGTGRPARRSRRWRQPSAASRARRATPASPRKVTLSSARLAIVQRAVRTPTA